MADHKRNIFDLLKNADTPRLAKLRQKENPVYRDCYKTRLATRLGESIPCEKEETDVKGTD